MNKHCEHKYLFYLLANLKLARQNSARVDVASVGLDWLIVAQDLSCGGSGHWSQKQAVANSMSNKKLKVIRIKITQFKSFVKFLQAVTYLAIFSLSAFQSQRSVGVTSHISYWRTWKIIAGMIRKIPHSLTEENTTHLNFTYTLANRTPRVRLIRTKFFSQLTAGLQGGVVDGLKDLWVE